MRVAVLGPQGSLGIHLCEELRLAGHDVDAIDRTVCDLATPDRESLYRLRDRFASGDCQLVVNTAAFTDVDGAEQKTDEAFLVNALGAELVARAADEAGAAICHLSTDFVFDGESTRPYDEFDDPRPLSAYARSKLAGERLVGKAANRSFIVRVGGLYGRRGRNFVSTLVSRLKAGQPLRIDRERWTSPTWNRLLARQLITLCERGEHGVYHATCQGSTTWFGFAEALCDEAAALGRDLPRTFVGVTTQELTAPALRPRSSLLDCRMLRLRGLLKLPPWREALRAYLTELLIQGEL